MNTIFLFSWRLIRGLPSHNTLHRMGMWCFLSITISTGSLALISAINHGIECVTLEKLKGLSPDIIISTPSQALNYENLRDTLKKDYGAVIKRMCPITIRHSILQHPDDTTDISTPVALMIVDPQQAFAMMNIPLKTTCIDHHHELTNLSSNLIILGDALAHRLNIHCGDTLLVRFPATASLRHNTLTLDSAPLTVGGIFTTGLSEWDNQVAFISFSTATDLFEDAENVEQVYLQLQSGASIIDIQQRILNQFKLPVITWKDLNPAIHSAMHLEHIALILILFLIALMTGMSTMSLISLLILSHQKTIATLQALGMHRTAVKKILICTSLIITWTASGIGLLIATVASWAINTYHLISLPDAYYSSYLPAHMSWTILISVFLLTSLVSVMATWYSSQQLNKMSIHNLLLR